MKKSDRVRNHNEKPGWGESSPRKRATGGTLHYEKERWGECSP